MGCGCALRDGTERPPESGVRLRARRRRRATRPVVEHVGSLTQGAVYLIEWHEYGDPDAAGDVGRYRVVDQRSDGRYALLPMVRSRRERTPIYLYPHEIDSFERLRMDRDPTAPPPPPSGVRLRLRAPAMRAGRALARGIRQSERTWEDVRVDDSLARHAKFVDYRVIDNVQHGVWTLGNMLYAQIAGSPRSRGPSPRGARD